MEIKRVEPNNTPVIRFCCDEMFHDLFGYLAWKWLTN